MILRGQNFTSKTDFLRWIDENTTLGECIICKSPILQIPFGRKRIVCGPACGAIRRGEEKLKSGKICVTCGRKLSPLQDSFRSRRQKRYVNVPTWLRELEAEQAAETAKKNGTAPK
jgi:hypothetical protein